MNTVIQTRIDTETRQNAERILKAMGLTLNDGIRIFLKQVIHSNAMPFQPHLTSVPNERVQQAMRNVLEGKDLISFDSLDDVMNYLRAEDEA